MRLLRRKDFVTAFEVLASAALAWGALRGLNLYQEDFRLFLDAARGAQLGANPYDGAALHVVVPSRETQLLSWFYPPHALFLFVAFLGLPLDVMSWVWMLAKALALVGLLTIWWRWYGRRVGWVPFTIVAFYSYRGPLGVDLGTGNVSIWEQLFFWMGAVLFFERREPVAGFFFFLSAQWKLTLASVAASAVVLVKSSRRLWGTTALFFAGSSALALFSASVGYPGLLSAYWSNLMGHSQSETGDTGWDGTHFSSLYNLNYGLQDPVLARWLWFALVGVVTAGVLSVAPRWRARNSKEEGPLWVAFLCASYGLCVPRLKLYSLAILIPPLLEVLAQAQARFLESKKWPPPAAIAALVASIAVTFGGTSMENHDLFHRLYNLRYLAATAVVWTLLYLSLKRRARESAGENGRKPAKSGV